MEWTKANEDFGEGGGLIQPSRRDLGATASLSPPAYPTELLPGGEGARGGVWLRGQLQGCIAGCPQSDCLG